MFFYLKIQNLSWIPIEINWKIFIVEPNDKKLVDVNVLFDDITEADLIKLANSQQNKPNTSQSTKKKKKIFFSLITNLKFPRTNNKQIKYI